MGKHVTYTCDKCDEEIDSNPSDGFTANTVVTVEIDAFTPGATTMDKQMIEGFNNHQKTRLYFHTECWLRGMMNELTERATQDPE